VRAARIAPSASVTWGSAIADEVVLAIHDCHGDGRGDRHAGDVVPGSDELQPSAAL